MKVSSIKSGLSALFLSVLLAGCSSNPVVEEQPTSTISKTHQCRLARLIPQRLMMWPLRL